MDKEELIEQLENNPGFYKHNNYKLVNYKKEEFVELKAEINENSLNPYGFAHGGVIFGLGDTAMGILARTTGRKAVTLNANISYLRPIKGKYFIAKAILIKSGKFEINVKGGIISIFELISCTLASYCALLK